MEIRYRKLLTCVLQLPDQPSIPCPVFFTLNILKSQKKATILYGSVFNVLHFLGSEPVDYCFSCKAFSIKLPAIYCC